MIDLSIDSGILLVQILSFVALWFALKKLLFDPVSAVLDERQKRTSGVQSDAHHMQEAAATAEADYQKRLQDVRRSLAGETDAERARTAAEQQRVMSEAQAAASTLLAAERGNIQQQAATARTALDASAQSLAALMLERIGGRKFS